MFNAKLSRKPSLPLAYAFRARASRPVVALALAALLVAVPSFVYYDHGHVQYGMRHALEFEPFLYALMVLALARRPSRAMTIALFAFAGFGVVEGIAWLRAVYAL